jgi:hypothetical protein
VVDDRVRTLRLLLAFAQVLIGGVWIGGALHDRQRPPAARMFTRSPRWMLIAGSVFTLCGLGSVVLLVFSD